MRTLLLNDTRGHGHLGCELTVRGILAQCRRVKLRVVGSVPVADQNDSAWVNRRMRDFDLLLINGEGSMHDDQPKALSLARAGELAASAGKRVVLINSVWQNNVQANRLLPYLDLAACRESASTQAIRDAGGAADTIPDALFSLEQPALRARRSGSGILVTDSVMGSLTRRLAWLACRHGLGFAPLWRGTIAGIGRRRFLSAALRFRCPALLDPLADVFLDQFAAAEAVVTGRFHAVCLCFWLGVPVAAIASNTHKIEGLFRDAKCNVGLLRPWPGGRRWLSLREFQSRIESQRASRQAVDQYVVDAKASIERLFDRIAALPAKRCAA